MSAARPQVAVIRLEGLRFRGRHGVLAAERRLGGPFQVDAFIEVPLPARQRDRLSDTLDYRLAVSRIRARMEGRSFRTMEALADAIALSLVRLPKAGGVRVRVTKLSPPFQPGATASVEVARRRA